MTNTHTARSVRPTVRLAVVAVAIGSILGAGVVNVSAQPAPRSAPSATIDAREAAELKAIADWAREQGLTGLSPASLHPVDQP